MAKRMLDCQASDWAAFQKEDWISSIRGCEGRVLACESVVNTMPMLGNLTNAEFCASQGADLLLLNIFDVEHPEIAGLPDGTCPKDVIRTLKHLTGNRLIAINLEPVPDSYESEDKKNLWQISEGRKATVKNALLAKELGVDMILLTGNPGNGVSNEAIEKTLKLFKEAVGEHLILGAGKMHASEVLADAGENIMTKEVADAFIKAGADIILMPAPGTVPGLTTEYIRAIIAFCHSKNRLTMTSVGTSQEGADTDTIKQIALMSKMAGADIHHLGDSAYFGMALPENIRTYSVVIRGIRHTYRRMAMSINR